MVKVALPRRLGDHGLGQARFSSAVEDKIVPQTTPEGRFVRKSFIGFISRVGSADAFQVLYIILIPYIQEVHQP